MWQKLSFSSPSLYPNDLDSILSFRRHCDVVLFTHHLVLLRSCYFLSYPFNRSVVFSFKFFHLIKTCASFPPECCPNSLFLFLVQLILTGVASKSTLSPKLLVLIIFLVPLVQRTVCNLGHLRCFVSLNLFNLSRFVVSLIGRRSNLVLPPLFLFCYPPVPS